MLAGNKEVSIFAARLKQNGTYIEGMSKASEAGFLRRKKKSEFLKINLVKSKTSLTFALPKMKYIEKRGQQNTTKKRSKKF